MKKLSVYLSYLLRHHPEDAGMAGDGYAFGMADNGVWCTESVPVKYICARLR